MKRFKINPLMYGLRASGGRTTKGPITSPRRGALVKKLYRFLDTKRIFNIQYSAHIIKHYIQDPNRSAYISLLMMPNGVLTFILAPEYSKHQTKIHKLYEEDNKNIGSSHYLNNLPLGSIIHNIELIPGQGGQIIRSAGSHAQLLKKGKYVTLKLKSGEYRLIPYICMASLGKVSYHDYFLKDYGKAGTIRRLGRRPRNRPSVRNPVDHPMGGRTKGGHPCSYYKLMAKTPTAKKKSHKLILISARKSRLSKNK